jgi:DNA topoisomerase I
MGKNLMIVESPAKAKTIEKFLDNEFVVKSSFGHIRDLGKGDKAIDIDNDFTPSYIIPDDKADLVKDLKKAAKQCDSVWLATDEDREGEAISWHLCEVLDLPVKEVNRIVFHEITKEAIRSAVDNPRKIDLNLVNAQQARRVLDRLVGFELSPILWRKTSVQTRLSAGRVQSVAVKLIDEREKLIKSFTPEAFYNVKSTFTGNDGDKSYAIDAVLNEKMKTPEAVKAIFEKCKTADHAIKNIDVKPLKRNPSPPFTTSTLQQEASRKLGFSVTKTMLVAQKLYEAGKISYMRTDSVNLSDSAINNAKKEISEQFGEKYSNPKKYQTKSDSAQEAHEAIRPSYFNEHTVEGDGDEERLYELIWKRAISSQMSSAELEKTTMEISISNDSHLFKATGEVLKFDGFLKVYIESTDEDEDKDKDESGLLPPLKVGQALELKEAESQEKFTRASARFNEASLVKKMEELGIGRPSTYAPTITTIQKRGYIVKENRDGVEKEHILIRLKNKQIEDTTILEKHGFEKNKLFPTDVAVMVTEFLDDHFENVMDYNFTAKIEKEFDEIAGGMLQWTKMLESFYKPFHAEVETTSADTTTRITMERELGKDPKSGRTVLCRMGKYGPMAQIGTPEELEEDEKPKYGKLLPNQSLQDITLEEALELFKIPKVIGEYEDEEVKVSIGRFGPYVQHMKKFYGLEKDTNIFEVKLDEAIILIDAKRKADAEKTIQTFEENADVQVLNGKYGPYIKIGRKNVGVPKDKDPEKLTLEECLEIVKNHVPKKRGKKAKK